MSIPTFEHSCACDIWCNLQCLLSFAWLADVGSGDQSVPATSCLWAPCFLVISSAASCAVSWHVCALKSNSLGVWVTGLSCLPHGAALHQCGGGDSCYPSHHGCSGCALGLYKPWTFGMADWGSCCTEWQREAFVHLSFHVWKWWRWGCFGASSSAQPHQANKLR